MSSSDDRKTKKRKHSKQDTGSGDGDVNGGGGDGIVSSDNAKSGTSGDGIEALREFRKLKKSWPEDMSKLFDPELPDERREQLWETMCDGGEELRQRFAWAIPDERALRIIKHFGPIVEIGSGLGYWAKLLRSRGVDVKAYDKFPGAPSDTCGEDKRAPDTSKTKDAKNRDKKGQKKDAKSDGKATKSKSAKVTDESAAVEEDSEDEAPVFWTEVEEGGPEVLQEPCNEKRALLLCYPDDFEEEEESLGLLCLHAFEGDVVIHVGEVFGDSICMTPGQTPWGRTTSRECQEELASDFHCILKIPLPSWPHSRDTLTVWKRHSFSTIQYDDDDDDEDSDSSSGDDGKGDGGKEVKTDENKRAKLSNVSENGGDGDTKPGKDSKSDDKKVPAGETKKQDPKSSGKGASGDASSGDEDDSDDDAGIEAFLRRELKKGEGEDDEDGQMPMMMPDMDIYALVPDDEEMSSAQAAPCVRFLLDSKGE